MLLYLVVQFIDAISRSHFVFYFEGWIANILCDCGEESFGANLFCAAIGERHRVILSKLQYTTYTSSRTIPTDFYMLHPELLLYPQ